MQTLGVIASVATLFAGAIVNRVGEFARADDEDRQAPRVRARSRTESLTLVDTIDSNKWRPDTFVVSPDGTRMAYAVLDGQGSGHIVVDGKAGPDYMELVGGPLFSADSRRVAYIARNAQDLWFAVVDGVERPDKHPSVKGHPGVSADLLFSLDGRRLAYVAYADSGSAVKQFVVVDRQEGAKCDEIAGLAISPNGERLAYAARTGNQWMVVVDGKEGPRHQGVLGHTPMFSPDGRHVAYAGRDGGRFFVVIDRKRGRDYDGMGGMILFAPVWERRPTCRSGTGR